MSFISKAEQSRHTEIDQMIDATADLLGDIRVIRALGSEPGRFFDVLADLYVPNLRGDQLVTPRQYVNDTSIPVFTLRGDETVRPSKAMTTLHARQIETLEDFAKRNEHPDLRGGVVPQVARQLNAAFTTSEPVTLRTEDDIIPRTVSTEVVLPIGSLSRVVKGRPAIYLPRFQTDMLNPADPLRTQSLMLFHHIVHAAQNLTQDPVLTTQFASHRVINENEALALETKVAVASLPKKYR